MRYYEFVQTRDVVLTVSEAQGCPKLSKKQSCASNKVSVRSPSHSTDHLTTSRPYMNIINPLTKKVQEFVIKKKTCLYGRRDTIPQNPSTNFVRNVSERPELKVRGDSSPSRNLRNILKTRHDTSKSVN